MSNDDRSLEEQLARDYAWLIAQPEADERDHAADVIQHYRDLAVGRPDAEPYEIIPHGGADPITVNRGGPITIVTDHEGDALFSLTDPTKIDDLIRRVLTIQQQAYRRGLAVGQILKAAEIRRAIGAPSLRDLEEVEAKADECGDLPTGPLG